jgi:hypothetical protein
MSSFLLVVACDRRLGVAHYRFVRAKLDSLVCNRLPDVRILSDNVLVERWADESHLLVDRYPHGQPSEAQFVEWAMGQRPHGVVLFEGGTTQWAELVRRARVMDVPIRRVDVRALLVGRR